MCNPYTVYGKRTQVKRIQVLAEARRCCDVTAVVAVAVAVAGVARAPVV